MPKLSITNFTNCKQNEQTVQTYNQPNFIKCTNRWNLDQAKKFIEQIKYINENNIEVNNWNKINIKSKKKTKNNSSNLYLPKYINVVRSKGQEIGYCVNGLMILDDEGRSQKTPMGSSDKFSF